MCSDDFLPASIVVVGAGTVFLPIMSDDSDDDS